MITPTPITVRECAAQFRRAADRISVIRLRLSHTIMQPLRADSEQDPTLSGLRSQWIGAIYPELGRIAQGLRTSAKRLDTVALTQERASGKRMGGYQGAGFLGKGPQALRNVHSVADYIGFATGHAARDDRGLNFGPLLAPDPRGPVLPHPSHTLGAATPDLSASTPDYDSED